VVICPYCHSKLRSSVLEPHSCSTWEARQLVLNFEGLKRLCSSLGISTKGEPYAVACRYLRWRKRNPQVKERPQ
jgi:hypothetical protein